MAAAASKQGIILGRLWKALLLSRSKRLKENKKLMKRPKRAKKTKKKKKKLPSDFFGKTAFHLGTILLCGVMNCKQSPSENKSADVIFHLTHLGMASGCGSRAPHLVKALMGTPLLLTREQRPSGQQKLSRTKLLGQKRQPGQRGCYTTRGASRA